MKGGSGTPARRFAAGYACGAPPVRLAKVGKGRQRSPKVAKGRQRSAKVGGVPAPFRSSLPHCSAVTSGALHYSSTPPSQCLPMPPNGSQWLPMPPNASQCQPACRPHCVALRFGRAGVPRGTFTFVKVVYATIYRWKYLRLHLSIAIPPSACPVSTVFTSVHRAQASILQPYIVPTPAA